jgi:hypothetical protein
MALRLVFNNGRQLKLNGKKLSEDNGLRGGFLTNPAVKTLFKVDDGYMKLWGATGGFALKAKSIPDSKLKSVEQASGKVRLSITTRQKTRTSDAECNADPFKKEARLEAREKHDHFIKKLEESLAAVAHHLQA